MLWGRMGALWGPTEKRDLQGCYGAEQGLYGEEGATGMLWGGTGALWGPMEKRDL